MYYRIIILSRRVASFTFIAAIITASAFAIPFAFGNSDEVRTLFRCAEIALNETPDARLKADAEKIYFFAANGVLQAFDSATSALAWKAEIGGRPAGEILATDAQLVIAAAPLPTTDAPASVKLSSISKATGITNWAMSLNGPQAVFLAESADGVLVAGANGTVELRAKTDGSAIWSRTDFSSISAAPAVSAKRILIATKAGPAFVLSARTGETLSTLSPETTLTRVAFADDRYVIGGDERGNLSAFAVKGGRRLWTFKAGARWLSVAATEFGVAAVSADNFAFLIAASSGGVVWRRRLTGRAIGEPAPRGNVLAVASFGENSAYVIDLKSGRIINQIMLREKESFIGAPLALSNNKMAALTSSGLSIWSPGGCPANAKAAPTAPLR